MRGGPCENEKGLSFKKRGPKVVKGGRAFKRLAECEGEGFLFFGKRKKEARRRRPSVLERVTKRQRRRFFLRGFKKKEERSGFGSGKGRREQFQFSFFLRTRKLGRELGSEA